MLVEFLRRMGAKYRLESVQFEKIARAIALERSDDPLFFDRVYLTHEEERAFLGCSGEFGALLFEEDAPYLLWLCKCLHTNAGALLPVMSSYIRAIQNTKRAGLNTYKRIGWDAHVLYVCQLTSHSFAAGIPPRAYEWDFDIQPIFDRFKSMTRTLSDASRFLLRIGSFLHDIGVTLGVRDHEENGAPLTERYYGELGISAAQLRRAGIALTADEVICVTKALVGNHQIINQVSAEASDRYICDKIMAIKLSFSSSPALRGLFSEEFADVMLMLAAADVMAVDDSLLSREKFEELMEAGAFLKSIISTGEHEREPGRYGLKRLVSLLPDSDKQDAEQVITRYADALNVGPDLYDFLYHVRLIGYAMTAVKQLGDTLKAVKLMDWCRTVAKAAAVPPEALSFQFDPDIDALKLSRILDADVDEIVAGRKIQFSLRSQGNVIDVTC